MQRLSTSLRLHQPHDHQLLGIRGIANKKATNLITLMFDVLQGDDDELVFVPEEVHSVCSASVKDDDDKRDGTIPKHQLVLNHNQREPVPSGQASWWR